jgi:hypothetical protein
MLPDLPLSVKSEINEKKKVVGGTKMEQERWRKKNVGETEEKLDELGSPDEKKGREAVQKAYKEYQDEEFARKSDRIEWLNQKAKYSKERWLDYYPHVHTLVKYELSFLELPSGYSVESEHNPKGIKLILRDRFGGIHIGGFTPCGAGVYDEQACRTSVNKIDDLITRLENNPRNGIYLP